MSQDSLEKSCGQCWVDSAEANSPQQLQGLAAGQGHHRPCAEALTVHVLMSQS